jgi:hypothetical protein
MDSSMNNHLIKSLALCFLVAAVGCNRSQPQVATAEADDVPAPKVAAEKPRPATRVALVSTGKNDAARNLLDLTGVALGKSASIQLLERQQIDRVLSEQKIALAGLLNPNQVVAVGKLLSVDLFAVVEAGPDAEEAIGLIVFDARSGARLWDAGLPAGGSAPESVANGVVKAATKYQAGIKPLQPICLLGVRNADLPSDQDVLCESLARILERKLLSSSSVVVLERRRLDQWTQEKSLPKEGPAAELLASLHFLELEISRAKAGRGVQAHVYLTESNGKRLGDVIAHAQAADASELVAPLVEGILQKVKAAPAPAGDRARESTRFLGEAKLAWSHKLWKQALESAEAAHALDPESTAARAVLAENLIHFAVFRVDPNGLTILSWGRGHPLEAKPEDLIAALRLAQRGLDLELDDLTRLKDPERRPLAQCMIRYMPARRSLRSFLNKLVYAKPETPESQQTLNEFRVAVDRFFRIERTTWAQAVSARPGDGDMVVPKGPQPDSFFSQYSHILQGQFELMTWNATDAAKQTRDITEAGKQWLDAARKQDPKSFQVWHLTWFLEDLYRFASNPMASWVKPDHIVASLGLFEAMAEHPYPLIRMYGRCGVLQIELKTGKKSAEDCRKQFQELKQQTFGLIQKPPEGNADYFRSACYKFLAFAIGKLNFGTPDDRTTETFQVCEFMMDRKELAADVVEVALAIGVLAAPPSGTPERRRQRLILINRAMAMGDDPQVRIISGLKQAMKEKLLSSRQKLLDEFPDLAPPPSELPWENARLLSDNTRFKDVQAFLAPTVVGEHVYVIGCGVRDDRGAIQLIRIGLSGDAEKVLGETGVTLKRYERGGASYGLMVNPPFVRGIAVGDATVFVGTITDGIYTFGLSGGPVRRIGEKEGLPTTAIESIAFHGGKLYAGLAGGYLVAIDEKTRDLKVLASSRRKEKLSPFDDLPSGFSVPYMVADPARDRLLFVLYENTNEDLYQTGPKKNSPAGLWELHFKTGKFTRHVRLFHYPRVRFGSGIRNDHILLSDGAYALDYDVAKDKPELLWAFNRVGPELGLERAKNKEFFSMNAPRLYRNGWLWSDRPFGRWNPETKKHEVFPRLGKPRNSNPFQPGEAIEPVGSDRLLIGDSFTLWVVTLKKGQ